MCTMLCDHSRDKIVLFFKLGLQFWALCVYRAVSEDGESYREGTHVPVLVLESGEHYLVEIPASSVVIPSRRR